jgi:hypothetical protein
LKRRTATRAPFAALLAIVALLAVSASAPAAHLPVGETAWTPGQLEECTSGDPQGALQLSLNVNLGRGYVVPPPGGAITWWSTLASGAGSQLAGLKVFRPVAPNTYVVVGEDSPRSLVPNVLNTFAAAIPVQPGDLIGLSIPAGSPAPCRFTTLEGEEVGFVEGGNPVGATVSPGSSAPSSRLNVFASVLRPPATISVLPEKGSFQGGSRVAVFGDSFERVQSVSFGSTPAQGFEVGNETGLVAIAPPGKLGSTVPITVTTPAGSATLEGAFTYTGCRVPRLLGNKLKPAKKRVRKAGCRVGRVKKLDGATAKTGRVVKQRPQPGKLLSPGTKINISLAPERG